jgi:hypothetical protein
MRNVGLSTYCCANDISNSTPYVPPGWTTRRTTVGAATVQTRWDNATPCLPCIRCTPPWLRMRQACYWALFRHPLDAEAIGGISVWQESKSTCDLRSEEPITLILCKY